MGLASSLTKYMSCLLSVVKPFDAAAYPATPPASDTEFVSLRPTTPCSGAPAPGKRLILG